MANRTTPPTTPPTMAPTFVLVEVESTLTEVVDGVEVDETVVVKFSIANTSASPVEEKVASRSLSSRSELFHPGQNEVYGYSLGIIVLLYEARHTVVRSVRRVRISGTERVQVEYG